MTDKIHLNCLWISTGAYIGDKRPQEGGGGWDFPYLDNLRRPNSKGALRRALADDTVQVRFDVDAPAGSHRAGETIPATAEGIGDDKLNVSGPDPASPLWWAIVQVSNGRVVVA
jgi:hypothetical protein